MDETGDDGIPPVRAGRIGRCWRSERSLPTVAPDCASGYEPSRPRESAGDHVLAAEAAVRGVKDVVDRLEVHETSAGVPSLQPGDRVQGASPSEEESTAEPIF